MGFGIYSTVAGANAREIEMQMIANNMANLQTTGFKESQVSFTSELDKNSSHDELAMAQALVREGRSHVNFEQGSLYHTGNPLDVAIQGDGFFEVQTPQGTRYTRNGNFSVNGDGVLVTSKGYPILSDGGPITLPQNGRVAFSSTGAVSSGSDVIANLRVVSFGNTDALGQEGGGLFAAGPGADAVEAKNFRIAHEHLENSNVDMLRNLTKLIEVARAYEAHQKSMSKQMQASEQLTQIAKAQG